MSTTDRLRVDVARAFAPLLQSARYKGAYGGRGSAKSHFFAEQLLIRCYARRTRAVCIREVQNSIRDSVRQLLVDKIQKLGLGGFFEVLDKEIRAPNGSLIIFKGMQSYNAETIKSLEAYDIAWVEEAQTLSAKSLELLRPTIRQEGSEIWFSWNPRHRTDPVDLFFRKNAPAQGEADPIGRVSVFVNWRDNPWFPDVLRKEMLYDKATDPERAEHIWEGAYGFQHGTIFSRLIDAAEKEGRIGNVGYDPRALVTTAWDLGYGDDTAVWFAQIVGQEIRLIDFYQNRAIGLDHYAKIVREKPYAYHQHILPHDGSKGELIAGSTIVTAFTTLFEKAPEILPRVSVEDGIHAARVILPRCWFDARKCQAGLEALRQYRYEYDEEKQVFKAKPLHDWTSDAADAFRYLAMGLKAKTEAKSAPPPALGQRGWMA